MKTIDSQKHDRNSSTCRKYIAGDKRHTTPLSRSGKLLIIALLMTASLFSGGLFAGERYTLFEAGQVRPLALSNDGNTLFAVNTPDNRLEAYEIKNDNLVHKGSVLVGVEPVAVAVAPDGNVWVVNHVSDSVSIIDASKLTSMRVVRTLLVGDEPRDIVFAGPGKSRAFITTAHRGQNSPVTNDEFITPGIGRADVYVYDSNNLGDSLEGDRLTRLVLFTDTPRALAVSPDGETVYAAGFKTGNQTTSLFEQLVTGGGGVPGAQPFDLNGDGIPEPHAVDVNGIPQPLTSLIVKFDGEHWVDERGADVKIWDDAVKFNLPDKDVFVIDAMANPPQEVANHASVGTVLYNMAVNPANGKIYVTNTEALNHVRFEGPGGLGSTVRGHFAESRITVIDGANVNPIHLNKHINYDICCEANPEENARSLAQPMEMAFSSDGNTVYVAAFGSDKIGIFDTNKLENDTFNPDPVNHITVTGGGPSGVVLDDSRGLLFVLTRYDDGISIIDTTSRSEISHITMHNPEPAHIRDGRRFQYDAAYTSTHGDSSCALCHVFGDMDQLAWDLGNPDGDAVNNPGPFIFPPDFLPFPPDPDFQHMKGPMTTQSLRGLANHGAMHWRGDRTGANDSASVQPDGGIFDEQTAFKKFNPAFEGLIGRHSQLTNAEIQAYTDFVLEITYPPNPIRNLDNSLTADQQAGWNMYFDPSFIVDSALHCNGCHTFDRNANEGATNKPGLFGTNGFNTFAFQQQFFKVPHMRNQYQKVGMFGMANSFNFLADDINHPNPYTGIENQHMGDQIRGFGFFHDGSVDTIFRFHKIFGFSPREQGFLFPSDPGNPPNLPINEEGLEKRRQLEQFLLVFDSNLYPVVGQQVTLTKTNGAVVGNRIDLLIAGADAGQCDLIASRKDTGYLYINGMFQSDISADAPLSDADLRDKASKKDSEITYTCTPPGNGVRLALDRDEDGYYNGDELAAGTDPANALSLPL